MVSFAKGKSWSLRVLYRPRCRRLDQDEGCRLWDKSSALCQRQRSAMPHCERPEARRNPRPDRAVGELEYGRIFLEPHDTRGSINPRMRVLRLPIRSAAGLPVLRKREG